ncbi:hypothetical protein BVX98_04515, partial [bacterium F11]
MEDSGLYHPSRLTKFIIFCLCIVFFFSNCLLAHAFESNLARRQASHWNDRKQSLQLAVLPTPSVSTSLPNMPSISQSLHDLLPSQITAQESSKWLKGKGNEQIKALLSVLPSQYGNIRKVKEGTSDTLILHIQDIHQNKEAQENISNLLQSLINQEKVDLVALEGAFGRIDLKIFRDFPDQRAVKMMVDYLFRENKISGPIQAGFFSPTKIPPMVGVDDRNLYKANVQAVKDSFLLKNKIKTQITNINHTLESKKSQTLNPVLRRYDLKVQSYQRKEIGLGSFVKYLSEINSKNGSRILKAKPRWTISTFLEALHLEETLNFSQVEHERALLLKDLLHNLSQTDTQSLMAHSMAFQTRQLSHTTFYSYLENLCEKNNISLKRYGAMRDYLQYLLLSNNIHAENLYKEVRDLEQILYDTLATTQKEKSLLHQSRYLYLLGKLVDFSLTKEEWREYKEKDNTQNLFPSPQGEGTGVEKIRSTNLSPPLSPLLAERGTHNVFARFYHHAESRDKAIASNLSRAISNHDAKVAVLVTGGFHSEGIQRHLQMDGKSPSIVTLVPKITKVDFRKGSAYLSVFTQEKTPLDKLFEGEKLFLARSPIPTRESLLMFCITLTTALRYHSKQLTKPFGQILFHVLLNSDLEGVRRTWVSRATFVFSGIGVISLFFNKGFLLGPIFMGVSGILLIILIIQIRHSLLQKTGQALTFFRERVISFVDDEVRMAVLQAMRPFVITGPNLPGMVFMVPPNKYDIQIIGHHIRRIVEEHQQKLPQAKRINVPKGTGSQIAKSIELFRQILIETLNQTGWEKTAAARTLQVSSASIHDWINALKINEQEEEEKYLIKILKLACWDLAEALKTTGISRRLFLNKRKKYGINLDDGARDQFLGILEVKSQEIIDLASENRIQVGYLKEEMIRHWDLKRHPTRVQILRLLSKSKGMRRFVNDLIDKNKLTREEVEESELPVLPWDRDDFVLILLMWEFDLDEIERVKKIPRSVLEWAIGEYEIDREEEERENLLFSLIKHKWNYENVATEIGVGVDEIAIMITRHQINRAVDEKQFLSERLFENKGSKRATCRAIGISLHRFENLISEYDIPRKGHSSARVLKRKRGRKKYISSKLLEKRWILNSVSRSLGISRYEVRNAIADLGIKREEVEGRHLAKLVEKHKGNTADAAREYGIGLDTIKRRLEKLSQSQPINLRYLWRATAMAGVAWLAFRFGVKETPGFVLVPLSLIALHFVVAFVLTLVFVLIRLALIQKMTTGPPADGILLYGRTAVPQMSADLIQYDEVEDQFELNPALFWLISHDGKKYSLILRIVGHLILWSALAPIHESIHPRLGKSEWKAYLLGNVLPVGLVGLALHLRLVMGGDLLWVVLLFGPVFDSLIRLDVKGKVTSRPSMENPLLSSRSLGLASFVIPIKLIETLNLWIPMPGLENLCCLIIQMVLMVFGSLLLVYIHRSERRLLKRFDGKRQEIGVENFTDDEFKSLQLHLTSIFVIAMSVVLHIFDGLIIPRLLPVVVVISVVIGRVMMLRYLQWQIIKRNTASQENSEPPESAALPQERSSPRLEDFLEGMDIRDTLQSIFESLGTFSDGTSIQYFTTEQKQQMELEDIEEGGLDGYIPFSLNESGQDFFHELMEIGPLGKQAYLLTYENPPNESFGEGSNLSGLPYGMLFETGDNGQFIYLDIADLFGIRGFSGFLLADRLAEVLFPDHARKLLPRSLLLTRQYTPHAEVDFATNERVKAEFDFDRTFEVLTIKEIGHSIRRQLNEEATLGFFPPEGIFSLDFQSGLVSQSSLFDNQRVGINGVGSGIDLLYVLKFGAKEVFANDPSHVHNLFANWNVQFAQDTGQLPSDTYSRVHITRGRDFEGIPTCSRYIFNAPSIHHPNEQNDLAYHYPQVLNSSRCIWVDQFRFYFRQLRGRLLEPDTKALLRIWPSAKSGLTQIDMDPDPLHEEFIALAMAEEFLKDQGFDINQVLPPHFFFLLENPTDPPPDQNRQAADKGELARQILIPGEELVATLQGPGRILAGQLKQLAMSGQGDTAVVDEMRDLIPILQRYGEGIFQARQSALEGNFDRTLLGKINGLGRQIEQFGDRIMKDYPIRQGAHDGDLGMLFRCVQYANPWFPLYLLKEEKSGPQALRMLQATILPELISTTMSHALRYVHRRRSGPPFDTNKAILALFADISRLLKEESQREQRGAPLHPDPLSLSSYPTLKPSGFLSFGARDLNQFAFQDIRQRGLLPSSRKPGFDRNFYNMFPDRVSLGLSEDHRLYSSALRYSQFGPFASIFNVGFVIDDHYVRAHLDEFKLAGDAFGHSLKRKSYEKGLSFLSLQHKVPDVDSGAFLDEIQWIGYEKTRLSPDKKVSLPPEALKGTVVSLFNLSNILDWELSLQRQKTDRRFRSLPFYVIESDKIPDQLEPTLVVTPMEPTKAWNPLSPSYPATEQGTFEKDQRPTHFAFLNDQRETFDRLLLRLNEAGVDLSRIPDPRQWPPVHGLSEEMAQMTPDQLGAELRTLIQNRSSPVFASLGDLLETHSSDQDLLMAYVNYLSEIKTTAAGRPYNRLAEFLSLADIRILFNETQFARLHSDVPADVSPRREITETIQLTNRLHALTRELVIRWSLGDVGTQPSTKRIGEPYPEPVGNDGDPTSNLGNHMFQYERFREMLPYIINERPDKDKRSLRIGVIGPSTGEEPASLLAMIIQAFEENNEWGDITTWDIHIHGLDISGENLARARKRLSGTDPFYFNKPLADKVIRHNDDVKEIMRALNQYPDWARGRFHMEQGSALTPGALDYFAEDDAIFMNGIFIKKNEVETSWENLLKVSKNSFVFAENLHHRHDSHLIQGGRMIHVEPGDYPSRVDCPYIILFPEWANRKQKTIPSLFIERPEGELITNKSDAEKSLRFYGFLGQWGNLLGVILVFFVVFLSLATLHLYQPFNVSPDGMASMAMMGLIPTRNFLYDLLSTDPLTRPYIEHPPNEVPQYVQQNYVQGFISRWDHQRFLLRGSQSDRFGVILDREKSSQTTDMKKPIPESALTDSIGKTSIEQTGMDRREFRNFMKKLAIQDNPRRRLDGIDSFQASYPVKGQRVIVFTPPGKALVSLNLGRGTPGTVFIAGEFVSGYGYVLKIVRVPNDRTQDIIYCRSLFAGDDFIDQSKADFDFVPSFIEEKVANEKRLNGQEFLYMNTLAINRKEPFSIFKKWPTVEFYIERVNGSKIKTPPLIGEDVNPPLSIGGKESGMIYGRMQFAKNKKYKLDLVKYPHDKTKPISLRRVYFNGKKYVDDSIIGFDLVPTRILKKVANGGVLNKREFKFVNRLLVNQKTPYRVVPGVEDFLFEVESEGQYLHAPVREGVGPIQCTSGSIQHGIVYGVGTHIRGKGYRYSLRNVSVLPSKKESKADYYLAEPIIIAEQTAKMEKPNKNLLANPIANIMALLVLIGTIGLIMFFSLQVPGSPQWDQSRELTLLSSFVFPVRWNFLKFLSPSFMDDKMDGGTSSHSSPSKNSEFLYRVHLPLDGEFPALPPRKPPLSYIDPDLSRAYNVARLNARLEFMDQSLKNLFKETLKPLEDWDGPPNTLPVRIKELLERRYPEIVGSYQQFREIYSALACFNKAGAFEFLRWNKIPSLDCAMCNIAGWAFLEAWRELNITPRISVKPREIDSATFEINDIHEDSKLSGHDFLVVEIDGFAFAIGLADGQQFLPTEAGIWIQDQDSFETELKKVSMRRENEKAFLAPYLHFMVPVIRQFKRYYDHLPVFPSEDFMGYSVVHAEDGDPEPLKNLLDAIEPLLWGGGIDSSLSEFDPFLRSLIATDNNEIRLVIQRIDEILSIMFYGEPNTELRGGLDRQLRLVRSVLVIRELKERYPSLRSQYIPVVNRRRADSYFESLPDGDILKFFYHYDKQLSRHWYQLEEIEFVPPSAKPYRGYDELVLLILALLSLLVFSNVDLNLVSSIAPGIMAGDISSNISQPVFANLYGFYGWLFGQRNYPYGGPEKTPKSHYQFVPREERLIFATLIHWVRTNIPKSEAMRKISDLLSFFNIRFPNLYQDEEFAPYRNVKADNIVERYLEFVEKKSPDELTDLESADLGNVKKALVDLRQYLDNPLSHARSPAASLEGGCLYCTLEVVAPILKKHGIDFRWVSHFPIVPVGEITLHTYPVIKIGEEELILDLTASQFPYRWEHYNANPRFVNFQKRTLYGNIRKEMGIVMIPLRHLRRINRHQSRLPFYDASRLLTYYAEVDELDIADVQPFPIIQKFSLKNGIFVDPRDFPDAGSYSPAETNGKEVFGEVAFSITPNLIETPMVQTYRTGSIFPLIGEAGPTGGVLQDENGEKSLLFHLKPRREENLGLYDRWSGVPDVIWIPLVSGFSWEKTGESNNHDVLYRLKGKNHEETNIQLWFDSNGEFDPGRTVEFPFRKGSSFVPNSMEMGWSDYDIGIGRSADEFFNHQLKGKFTQILGNYIRETKITDPDNGPLISTVASNYVFNKLFQIPFTPYLGYEERKVGFRRFHEDGIGWMQIRTSNRLYF